jgi:hypothetical protein
MRPVGDGAKRPVVSFILCKAMTFPAAKLHLFSDFVGKVRFFV